MNNEGDGMGSVSAIMANVLGKLPQQNPLNFYLHNNVLAAFENEPFWEGVKTAAALYGGRPVKEINSLYRSYTAFFMGHDRCWIKLNKVFNTPVVYGVLLILLVSIIVSIFPQGI